MVLLYNFYIIHVKLLLNPFPSNIYYDLQFILEIHHKISSAMHHRHKFHRLAAVEALVKILGSRAATASTSK